MEDQTRSLSEVAGLMGVSERTVRRWIKSGRLKAYKPGRDYRIPESGIRRFIEESEVSPKAERRSLLEPSLFNDLEEERRLSLYANTINLLADSINAAADKWIAVVSDPDTDIERVMATTDAALDLAEFISEHIPEEPREALPNPEALEIISAPLENLNEVAKLGIQRVGDQQLEEGISRRRQKIKEWTRRISA